MPRRVAVSRGRGMSACLPGQGEREELKMKRSRAFWPCLLAAVLIAAIAAASAAAVEPAFYECKSIGKGKGNFAKGCKVHKAGGGYELVEGIGKGKPFKGKGGAATLHTPAIGGEITCTSFKDEGVMSSPTTQKKIVSVFSGCSTIGKKCTSPGQKAGLIKTFNLAATIGYISKAEHRVGADLVPETGKRLAGFTCEGLSVIVEGSVIGEVRPVNTVSKVANVSFVINGEGFQTIQKLEGAPKDVLLATVNGGGPFESGQQCQAETKGEELELKA
jgi:hypothetical protein